MACNEWADRLDSFLDGERPENEMRAVSAHLRSCASCAADAVSGAQLRRLTQSAGRRYSPSSSLRRRVQASIAPRRASFRYRQWAPAVAAAAVVVVALSLSVTSRRTADRERAFAEIADLHVTDLASPNPVDVVSSDSHTVKPWFAGKLPFSFNLPELKGSPFTLVGGRMTYFDQLPGAHLLFTVRQHRISVFVFQDRAGLERLGQSSSRERSFNVRTWTEGGLRYFAITDAAPANLNALSEMLKSAARS